MKELIIAVNLLAMITLANAEVTYVAAIADNTEVYESNNGKQDVPIFTVGTFDRLQVLETGNIV
jgi:hypothetical protein